MESPPIHIAGLTVQEPVTVLTNLVMALMCFVFYFSLRASAKNDTGRYWSLFFLFFALNSLAGLVAHGFNSYFSETVNTWVWKFLNNLLNVPCAYALFMANISFAGLPAARRKNLNTWIIVSCVLFTALIVIINKFWVGMINASLAMLITFIHYLIVYRRRVPGTGLVAFGFGFSFLSVAVHSAKLSVSEWFNHKDIAHVIIIIGLYIIYLGVKKSLNSAPGEGSVGETGEKLERAVA